MTCGSIPVYPRTTVPESPSMVFLLACKEYAEYQNPLMAAVSSTVGIEVDSIDTATA